MATTLTELGQAGVYNLIHLMDTAYKVRSLHDEHLTPDDRVRLDEIHGNASHVLAGVTYDGEFDGRTLYMEASNTMVFLINTPVELSENAMILWKRESWTTHEPVVVRFGTVQQVIK